MSLWNKFKVCFLTPCTGTSFWFHYCWRGNTWNVGVRCDSEHLEFDPCFPPLTISIVIMQYRSVNLQVKWYIDTFLVLTLSLFKHKSNCIPTFDCYRIHSGSWTSSCSSTRQFCRWTLTSLSVGSWFSAFPRPSTRQTSPRPPPRGPSLTISEFPLLNYLRALLATLFHLR